MDAHKDGAATFGYGEQVAPLGEDEERLGAAGDENQENHSCRVDFIELRYSLLPSGDLQRICSRPRPANLQKHALQRELEVLLALCQGIHETGTKHG